jgi:DEAD/DEAH box helicase domain-containing protein
MNSKEYMGIELFAQAFLNGKYSPQVVSHWIQEKQDELFADIPKNIHPILQEILHNQFPKGLFSHQVESWKQIKSGKNVVISTGTSSGKSLCYHLPIFNQLIEDNNSTSLLLFPTKALASDQLLKFNDSLEKINFHLPKEKLLIAATYDGDTANEKRIPIRNLTNILLSNPDMLHIGILPHHTRWDRFLKNLNFIVIDEVHFYRGVFGSHFANVIRRLKRILHFYGGNPQFILTSATISNPKDFAEKLIEEKFELINIDCSPKEKRLYFFLNPPVINEDLGLRKSMIDQSVEIVEMLMREKIQSILFARTRKTVEITVKKINDELSFNNDVIHGYRSGYLPQARRNIEDGLRKGLISTVISTNALELGIDMGKVDAVLMMGYPGSISAFFQQSGRAGRRNQTSIAILIASASPIDQYIIRHSEYVREGNPENALLDPNNPLILLNHLKSAAFELPFKEFDQFGNLDWNTVQPYLEILCDLSKIVQRKESYYWVAEDYPASEISLRNISKNAITLRLHDGNKSTVIGEVDYQSASRLVHPGAVYLHDGMQYLVQNFNLKDSIAELSQFQEEYITEPIVNNSIKMESIILFNQNDKFKSTFGELHVIEKVTGFKRIDWVTQQLLGKEDLYMPENELFTKGVWICFSSTLVNVLRENNQWQSDPNQYGNDWTRIRTAIMSRDEYRCQVCGLLFASNALHIHHKVPFRSFSDPRLANQSSNLITLCPVCHKIAEQNIRIRSGLAGVAYLLASISPLFLMCDYRDIGYFSEAQSDLCEKQPAIAIYDQFPGGIGLSAKLFDRLDEILIHCFNALNECPCSQGCPSCIGPSGENGKSGKDSAKTILASLIS